MKKKKNNLGFFVIAFFIIIAAVAFGVTQLVNAKNVIDPRTKMGIVTLDVKNISLVKQYYEKVLLFSPLNDTGNEVVLGKNIPLLRLVQNDNLPPDNINSPGLYHVAVVYSARAELARTLYNALMVSGSSFVGSANHSVSESFYFVDPEGNNIELYYDVDKTLWKINNGSIEMETGELDVVNYITKYIGSTTGNVTVRHVHLKVSDVSQAKKFYVDTLGFTLTGDTGDAMFAAAGGYHHNIAANTWLSKGASPRGETLGLDNFEIIIPADFLSKMEKRLTDNSISYTKTNNVLYLSDPFGNKIHVVAE